MLLNPTYKVVFATIPLFTMNVSSYYFPFLKKKQLTKDTISLFFDTSKTPGFSFLPGQYMRMIIPSVQNDPQGSSRNFSISSSPFKRGYITITTKISKSPFKRYLTQMDEGEVIEFFGPIGRFVLDETDMTQRVFLAGGIGITPFCSMLTYATDKHLKLPLTLIVSFSSIDKVIFYKELKRASKSNSHIRTVFTLTDPHIDHPKVFETGRISKEMIRKHCTDIPSAIFFLSGPQTVVDEMHSLLIEMGIDQKQIKKEIIIGY